MIVPVCCKIYLFFHLSMRPNGTHTTFMKRSERVEIFVREIWDWFAVHKRTLPWRDLPDSDLADRAYKILVSEVMLQQTQVSRVKIVFKDFLERFPHIEDLAVATNKDVLLAWRGMGYNNRAIRLRDAAKHIVQLQIANGEWRMANGELRMANGACLPTRQELRFPVTMEDLQKIPGVGHYTAAAIRNFAFNLPTPCLDTNIRRILHRTFIGPEYADGTWKKDDAYLLEIAGEVLDVALSAIHHPLSTRRSQNCADWHSALMDFGSLVCTKARPKWDICPLTHAGIMKAAYKVPAIGDRAKSIKKEPGRYVGSKYIPNRIFRGKVIDELRDSPAGLTAEQIGRNVCIDWESSEHREWLGNIIDALKKDQLIAKRAARFLLKE